MKVLPYQCPLAHIPQSRMYLSRKAWTCPDVLYRDAPPAKKEKATAQTPCRGCPLWEMSF